MPIAGCNYINNLVDVIAMKTDAAMEYSFDDEKQGDEEASDLFHTPSMRCLQIKKEFLKKARNYKFWGRNWSRQRVIAMDTLFKYCEESIQLTMNDDKLYRKMWLEIHNLVLKDHPILPIPKTIREKLGIAVNEAEVEDDEDEDSITVNAILEQLGKLRGLSLSQYESKEWSRIEQLNEDSFQLRKLRKRIYDGVNVAFDTMDYDFAVSKFLVKFKEMLTPEEVNIWNQKRLDTLTFAEELPSQRS